MLVRAATDDGDSLRYQPAGNEAQDLRRGLIEPLRIVNDAEQRLSVSNLGQQRQRGDPHQEPVWGRSAALAEHGGQRVALGSGQPVEVIDHGRQS